MKCSYVVFFYSNLSSISFLFNVSSFNCFSLVTNDFCHLFFDPCLPTDKTVYKTQTMGIKAIQLMDSDNVVK